MESVRAAPQPLAAVAAAAVAVALIGVTALGILAAPAIVWLSAPGFTADPDKFALTVDLLRITFPYILFISLTALGAGMAATAARSLFTARRSSRERAFTIFRY